MKTILNNKIHLISQPQSGIGKSYISFLLRQYLETKFDVKQFSIKEKNTASWDQIFESFFSPGSKTFIINVNSFLYETFKNYISEAKVLELIADPKDTIIYHNIFSSGRNGENTKETINYVARKIQSRVGQTIVWENQNSGISLKQHSRGRYIRFSDLPEFGPLKENIEKIIFLKPESYYFQKDLSIHILSDKTFDQAIHNSEYNLIYRQRLYQIKKQTFEAIEHGIN